MEKSGFEMGNSEIDLEKCEIVWETSNQTCKSYIFNLF